MKRLISFTTVLEVVLLLLVRVASPAEPPGQEITIDGKPIQGRARIEITTDKPDPGAASPTGREPRILWSRQWQARWQRAAAENHPWHQWLQFAVENPASAHFDKELFPTILYQISGETRHARQAWAALEPRLDPQRPGAPGSQDVIRANWLKWIVCYEWLYPALTGAERGKLAAHLDRCAEAVAATPLADSDRLVTAWFGLQAWSALGPPDGPDTAKAITETEHFAAMRQRLVEYAKLSAGGEWIEGSQYNQGTAQNLMLGLSACKDLGIAVPDELSALPAQFANAALHRMDGTVRHRMTWGAIQVANFPRTGINRLDLIRDEWCSAAALSDNAYLRDRIARSWDNGGHAQKPHAGSYLLHDPYGETAWPPLGPLGVLRQEHLVCQGQQMMFARSSWEPDATLVMFRCGRHNGFAHHPTFDGGHFEMLRKGEWVLTRPRAYSDSGNVDGAGANNSLLLGNQPINFARREMLGAGEVRSDPIHRVGQDPINGVTTYYLVQDHGGPWQHGNNRTAEYVHSAKRWLVWVRSDPIHGVEDRINPVTTSDVLLIREVLNVSQPPDQRADRKAYNIGKAAERHAEYIASQAADEGGRIPLVQWIIHAPAEPRKGGVGEGFSPSGGIEWSTPGGQRVRVTTLLPAEAAVEFLDETNHYVGVAEKERGWQVRISPAGFTGGELELLHAVVVSDGDADAPGQASITLDPDGAVLVQRAGHQDARVIFSDKGVEVR